MDNFENIQMIVQPKELKTSLYPHQLASVFVMEERERTKEIDWGKNIIHTNIGVNADETGYGKTLSMITLLLRDKMEWDMQTPYADTKTVVEAYHKIKKTTFTEYYKLNSNLVMVSHTILKQWEQELDKTPLKYVRITNQKELESVKPDKVDVVLVIPKMFNKLIIEYHGHAWKRFIFDEPGNMKVPAMRDIVAGFYWFVTATPYSMFTLHMRCKTSFMYQVFCKDLSYHTFDYHFGFLLVKNDKEFIKQSYSFPPTYHHYHKCFQPIYNTIKGLVNPRITAMIEAGNISGAIKALGGKGTDNVTELIKKRKELEIQEIETRIAILGIRGDQEVKIKSWKEQQKRVKNQLLCLEERFEDIMSGDCNICFDKIIEHVMEPNCQNVFCGICLLTWLKTKTTCPLCRNNVDVKNLIYINSKNKKKDQKTEQKIKTKTNTIIDLIKNKTNGKFIIFSNWNETFNSIRNELFVNGIGFVEITGRIQTIEENLRKFKEGETRVMFLNSRFNGAGLNLQETTDIILYHEMNKDLLNQLLGRANRLGRTKPLQVHHLIIN